MAGKKILELRPHFTFPEFFNEADAFILLPMRSSSISDSIGAAFWSPRAPNQSDPRLPGCVSRIEGGKNIPAWQEAKQSRKGKGERCKHGPGGERRRRRTNIRGRKRGGRIIPRLTARFLPCRMPESDQRKQPTPFPPRSLAGQTATGNQVVPSVHTHTHTFPFLPSFRSPTLEVVDTPAREEKSRKLGDVAGLEGRVGRCWLSLLNIIFLKKRT